MDLREHTSIKEEIVNSVTHGLGAVLGIPLLLVLAFNHSNNDPLRVLGFTIFGVSLIAFYLISTLFHSLIFTKARKVFQTLDHCFIFLVIAGTYTPFALITFKGKLGWEIFALVWGITILAVIIKAVFSSKLKILSLFLYLIFGWLGAFLVKHFSSYLPSKVIFLLILGGLFYTLGIIFYLWKKLPFNHGIWHLFVLGGSICHALAVYYI